MAITEFAMDFQIGQKLEKTRVSQVHFSQDVASLYLIIKVACFVHQQYI